jgi:hypothetical protein
MGALASAFHGLATKGPLGGINKAIGTVGGKIGLPGMSKQGVPGFKAKKPSVGQQAGQLGQMGAQMNPGAMQPPGTGLPPQMAGTGVMGPSPLTPQIAMSGAQQPAQMFPQPQGQGDQNPFGG